MTNLTKWSIVVIVICLAGLGVLFLGSTWQQEEIPDMTESNTGHPAAIPALDSAAPAHTETAAFALG